MIRQRGTFWVVELYDKTLRRKFQVRPADYGMETPKTEEQAKELEFLAKRAGSRAVGPMTVRKYHDQFIERRFNHAGHEIKQQTNDYYAERLKRFVAQYGDLAIDAITTTEAAAFALDPDTRSSAREVKAMFASAKRDGIITSDPFDAISVQQRKGKPKAFLRKHDVEALAEAALIVHGEWGPTFRAWILWTAWLGLRPSEGAGSQWEFFDQDAELYDVQFQWHGKLRKLLAPKHDSTGLVHVFDPAAQAAASVQRRGSFMFPGKEGQPMDGATIHNNFKPVKHIAGLPDATPGALRHFLASYMLNELGLPPYTIAQQLRHSDGGKLVVKTYGHPDRAIHLSRIAQAEAAGAYMGQQGDDSAAI